MFARRHWIPPAALIYAQLAHGLSWAIVLWSAWSGALRTPFYGFAWIHTVALGWVTMAALAILLHALPNFVDVPWRGETAARWSLVGYGAGVALLVFGFFGHPGVMPAAGSLVFASLLVYLATVLSTLVVAMRGERVQRAVARAFTSNFTFLFITAFIGFGLAWMVGGRSVPGFVASLPAAHANLGLLGWLSMLIFGVSMRTLRPIAGQQTRMFWMHIVVGTLALLGVPLIAAGVAAGIPAMAWTGAVLFGIAGLGYSVDVLDVIRRAKNPHRPPQAFVVAAVLWFLAALAVGAGVLAGKPWQQAYVFMLLAGWVGQFVNAHLYHIGIRVVSTVYRGEDDETRPQELLEARLSWFSFLAFQVGIIVVTIALMNGSDSLAARGAVFGAAGWIAVIANVQAARLRAKVQPKTIVLP